jgi:hypothetical protein
MKQMLQNKYDIASCEWNTSCEWNIYHPKQNEQKTISMKK